MTSVNQKVGEIIEKTERGELAYKKYDIMEHGLREAE